MSNEDYENLIASKLDKLDSIEDSINEIKKQLEITNQMLCELEKNIRTGTINPDIAHIQSDITVIKADTNNIKNVLNIVEEVTAKKWTDIIAFINLNRS